MDNSLALAFDDISTMSRKLNDPALDPQATEEVDAELVAWFQSLTLHARLRTCSAAARAVVRFRDVASEER